MKRPALLSLAAAVSVLALALVLVAGSRDSAAAASTWRVVVLGDSQADGSGDPTRLAWGGRYGHLLQAKLRQKVIVTNLAVEGKTTGQLLAELRADQVTRAAVKAADVILFGSTSGSHLNEADDDLQAKRCAGKACYAKTLRAWARDFRQIVTAAVALRAGKKTVLRGVTDPNVAPGAREVIPPFVTTEIGLYQAKLVRATVCGVLKAHGGRCVDVLTAFNGASGTEDAYEKGLMNKAECCYGSARGQQLIARLLIRTGLKPVR